MDILAALHHVFQREERRPQLRQDIGFAFGGIGIVAFHGRSDFEIHIGERFFPQLHPAFLAVGADKIIGVRRRRNRHGVGAETAAH